MLFRIVMVPGFQINTRSVTTHAMQHHRWQRLMKIPERANEAARLQQDSMDDLGILI